MSKPVARLTTPAQMVASLPLWLGYVPTESLVVVCCHEPRGRIGLSLRIDLPAADVEPVLVHEIVRRVRQQKATRVLLAVYTDEPDGTLRARAGMVGSLRAELEDLVITEAVLVRGGRFWSYLCDVASCCPPEGRSVSEAQDAAPIRLLEAERVLEGKYVMADRDALEASLAGPSFLAGTAAVQRCEIASALREQGGIEQTEDAAMRAWWVAVDRWRTPPGSLGDQEAATLAVSLAEVQVRDQLAAASQDDVPPLLALLAELCRRTPAPYDAPVCTLYAWVTYCEGGGAEVTIALERALRSDPDYSMAHLLLSALDGQVEPKILRKITRSSRILGRRAG